MAQQPKINKRGRTYEETQEILELRRGSRTSRHIQAARKGTRKARKELAAREYDYA